MGLLSHYTTNESDFKEIVKIKISQDKDKNYLYDIIKERIS